MEENKKVELFTWKDDCANESSNSKIAWTTVTGRLLNKIEFMGLSVDLEKVFKNNIDKSGPNVIRKNNFLINTGDNLTLEERKRKIEENRKLYGLSKAQIRNFKIPKLLSQSVGHYLSIKQIIENKNNFSLVEKIEHLKRLKRCMRNKIRIINKVEERRRNLKEKNKMMAIVLKKNDDGFSLDSLIVDS